MPDLHPQRYFQGDTSRKRIAQQLYEQEQTTPLICPHGHVPPQLFADVPYQPGTGVPPIKWRQSVPNEIESN